MSIWNIGKENTHNVKIGLTEIQVRIGDRWNWLRIVPNFSISGDEASASSI
jgi:hypothetical protein